MSDNQAPVVVPAENPEVVAEGTIVEAAATAPEVKPEVEQKPVQEDPRFAQKFAALSRREKQLKDRERAMQMQLQEFENKMKAFEAERAEALKYKSMPDEFKKAPRKFLKDHNLTEQQIADLLLNDGPTPEMQQSELEAKLQAKIDAMEAKLKEKEEREQNEKLEATLSSFMTTLTGFVNDTPDYELIRANNGTELVYNVIEQHYAKTLEETGEGEVLDNKTACDLVENYFLEEAKKLIDRDKVKKLLQPTPVPPAAPKGKPTPTLSNTQASVVPQKPTQPISRDESLKQAAALIRWED